MEIEKQIAALSQLRREKSQKLLDEGTRNFAQKIEELDKWFHEELQKILRP